MPTFNSVQATNQAPAAQTAPATPTQVYSALKLQRNEITRLLESAKDIRDEAAQRLRNAQADVDRKGLEQQISSADGRIAQLNKELAVNEMELTKVAAIPGAVPPPAPPPTREVIYRGPDVEALMVAAALGVVFLFGTIVMYERRLMKRWARMLAALPANLGERLSRIESTVDDMSVDPRRLGEGTPYFGSSYDRDREAADRPTTPNGTRL